MTTAVRPPTHIPSTGYTLPNARRVSFEERTARNPRPAKLTPECLIERALVQRGTIARIRGRYFGYEKKDAAPTANSCPIRRTIKKTNRPTTTRAHSIDATEIAIDVVARIVEVNAHARYNPELASVDSFIVGFARMWFRKQVEVRGRRERIIREGMAKQPPRTTGTFVHGAIDQEQSDQTLAAIRSRLTPMEGRLLNLLVRQGRFDADHVASALGTDPTHARSLMAGVRKAAQFLGYRDGAPRPVAARTAQAGF